MSRALDNRRHAGRRRDAIQVVAARGRRACAIGFVVLLYRHRRVCRLRLVAAEDDVRRAQVQLARVVTCISCS